MTIEIIIRVAAAALVFAAMASWEALAPRRPWAVGRAGRWPHNLGILVVDAVTLRVLIPTAAVGAALFAAGQGWGLLHIAGFRLSIAVKMPNERLNRFHHVTVAQIPG